MSDPVRHRFCVTLLRIYYIPVYPRIGSLTGSRKGGIMLLRPVVNAETARPISFSIKLHSITLGFFTPTPRLTDWLISLSQ